MMNFSQSNHINDSGFKSAHFDATMPLAGAALPVVFLIAIDWAAQSPSTPPGELLSMAVLP